MRALALLDGLTGLSALGCGVAGGFFFAFSSPSACEANGADDGLGSRPSRASQEPLRRLWWTWPKGRGRRRGRV